MNVSIRHRPLAAGTGRNGALAASTSPESRTSSKPLLRHRECDIDLIEHVQRHQRRLRRARIMLPTCD
jgi:hypothetical protein